jgi:hypothetical protein
MYDTRDRCFIVALDVAKTKFVAPKMRTTARSASALRAASARRSKGSESTYWRTGTSGTTRSTRCAAVFAMRRPAQLGHAPRCLHENATSRSWPQLSQRQCTKPCANTPHRKYARNSAST